MEVVALTLGRKENIMNTIQGYLESPDVKKLAKSTRELYGHALKHADEFCAGRGPWPGWLSKNLDRFARHLENKGLSGKSIQQYLTCTKIFLKWAGHPVEFTYKISNKARQANKKKHLDRWFTEKDIALCIAYRFENGDALKYQAIVRLMVETGARVGEIAGIRPIDMHLEERYVLVQGKTEPRPVIISDGTAQLLEQIIRHCIPVGVKDSLWVKEKKIFPDVSRVKSAITKMLEDLGLKNGKDGRGPHTFRHFTATYLFYEGDVRIEDIAFLLGDTVETIRERYLHPTPEMLKGRVFRHLPSVL